ncbi:MAG: PQQ-binding-like beta-propeller repeat protein [Verrucomicrobia bacterium]|nr:PQQ-binding-like beta-propeller repeat protein [Verrucomicrobiota bacterium]
MRSFCVLTAVLWASSLQAAPGPEARAREIYGLAKISGGVVAYLGCEEPELLAALRRDEHHLVQAFDRDAGRVGAARERLKQLGVYGGVSALVLDNGLPYPDNTLNCVIAPSFQGLPVEDARRALCPGGVLCYRQNGKWVVERKPFPTGMDQWTHFLYDARNNTVSHDTLVGPSRSLQWVAAPRWARDHGQLGWVMVTAGGKLFSIEDEGPIFNSSLPAVWKLICRDAFNGVVLWKRDVPDWFEHLYFRSGPSQLMRRLVAQDGKVFATLGLCAPVSVLDPGSGQTLRTLDGSANTAEMVSDSGVIFLLINPDLPNYINQYYLPRTTGLRELPKAQHKIVVVSAETGAVLWQKGDDETMNVMELTLAADARHIYFLNSKNLVCLDRASGKTLWKTPRVVAMNRPTWSSPTLMVNGPLVYLGDRDASQRAPNHVLSGGGAPATIAAFSTEDGRLRWECPAEDGFHFPVDVMAIGGRIWSGALASKDKPGFVDIRDALTGEVTLKRKPDTEYCSYSAGHHRCHRNKATERYLITGRDGIQWIDVKSGALESDRFIRGNCQFGVMPANGLLYVPPNGCACNFYEKLPGILALSPNAPAVSENASLPKPVRGASAPLKSTPPAADEWPAYRHDNQRSAAVATSVSLPLASRWTRPVGGRLSSLTAANGRVFVASVDRHTLYALDAARGNALWEFTAQGRIDSPPTVAEGKVYFGSCDGFVYALDAATGSLHWKLQAAPMQRFIQSYGQMESSWPVSGSVLVRDGFVYALAGRSPYLDGGMFLYKIHAQTGEVAARRLIAETPAGRDRGSVVFQPDILSADADCLFIRQARFSCDDLKDLPLKPHLWSGTGFLDDTLFNRAYWMYADRLEMGNPHWFIKGNTTPAGTILCFDDKSFYCFGQSVYGRGARKGGEAYNHLFAAPRDFKTLPWDKREKFAAAEKQFVIPQWAVRQDMDVLAMARTTNCLFIAGTLNKIEQQTFVLRAVNPANGEMLAEFPLASPPVFDGLIASSGRLFLALKDGSVHCMGAGTAAQ